MDGARFDRLTRSLSSRRTALGGLLGGSLAVLLGLGEPEEATAHTFLASCRRIKHVQRRQACLRRARAHNRSHRPPPCVPQALALTCNGRCGVYANNCHQATACPCPGMTTCLSNGSCAQVCTENANCCAPCGCGCGRTVEGLAVCRPVPRTCEEVPERCTSTATCPVGLACQAMNCGVGGATEGRCHRVCPS